MSLKPLNRMTWEEFQERKASLFNPSGSTPPTGIPSLTGSDGPSSKTLTTGKTKAQKAGWVAKKTWHQSPVVGLIRCRSIKEAKRAAELDQLVENGTLLAWWYETPLYCGFDNDDGSPVRMFPDFKLLYPDGRIVYQDTKPGGKRKPQADWTLRRKAVRQHLGITVEVI